MRKVLKRILPSPVVNVLGNLIVTHRARQLAKLSASEAFDQIYDRKLWQQGESLSGLGSQGRWAREYQDFVIDYIMRYSCRVVVDAGCGDFVVGRRIAEHVPSFRAVDISPRIVEINRNVHKDMSHVSFDVLNLISDPIPSCDLLLVRQVFQHLSNDQVEATLRNIERSSVARVLITEHTLRDGLLVHPNLDLGSHSVRTRVGLGSGLDIGLPPFSRNREIVAVLEPGPENGAENGSVLNIYELLP